MKLFAAVTFFAAFLSAQQNEEVEKGGKPCCATKEPSFDCGDGCGGCFKKYLQKLDFYHTKPILAGKGKNWNYLYEEVDPLLMADDGVFRADCHGGVIDSTVFTHWNNDTAYRFFDTAKFFIYAKAPVDVPKNGDLVIEFEGSGETFKTDQNPYPKEITQPNDVRFASNKFVAFDMETELAFSFVLTNDRVYVSYTRHNYQTQTYAAFTFLIPVKMRKTCDWHNMKVVLHGASKQVSWRLEGREVFRITKPGYLIDRQYMVVDAAGQEGPAFPEKMWYGIGTSTGMHLYPACKRSDTCCDCKFPTVREALANAGNVNATVLYNPLLGNDHPAVFWAPYGETDKSDFIWGQGAMLKISKLVVYQDLCSGRKC